MRIEKYNDCIKIFDCVDFDIKKILECGQIFRFCIDDLGEYVVNSQDKIAHIKQGNPTLIFTKDVDYFYNFFDLNTNYDKLQNSYLFVEIANRVKKYTAENPAAEIFSAAA